LVKTFLKKKDPDPPGNKSSKSQLNQMRKKTFKSEALKGRGGGEAGGGES